MTLGTRRRAKLFENRKRVTLTPQIELYPQRVNDAVDNRRQLTQMRCLLREGVSRCLTPRQRQVVELYYYKQLTMTQIAEQLGVNPSTVSRHLKAARGRLMQFTSQIKLLERIMRS